MNLGTTLKSVEKKFGPAVAGEGDAATTFSALRYPAGRSKKFAGVHGRHENAVFYLHFPIAVDWSQLKTKKGTPDFINDLRLSGPQGQQGREIQAAAFREAYLASKRLRTLLSDLVGKKAHRLRIQLDEESFEVEASIAKDKKGKITVKFAV